MPKESILKPELIVFAGPNGSGKSTVTKRLLPKGFIYVNPDEITKEKFKGDNLKGANEAERQREELLSNGKNFAFETVLSRRDKLEFLKKAKRLGYFIRCYYVLTCNSSINVRRVNKRKELGGHGVPEDKIISRHKRALDLVKELIPVCDVIHIYDNSGSKPFRIFKKRKNEHFYDECEYWKLEDIISLTQVKHIEEADLNRDSNLFDESISFTKKRKFIKLIRKP